MIKKYKEFINDAIFSTKIEFRDADFIFPSEYDLLRQYKIEKFKYNPETKFIDVFEDVSFSGSNTQMSHKKLKNLPEIRFGVIHGDFNCSSNELSNLKNCPFIVRGDFNCKDNKLKSLKFCPKEVHGSFSCKNNQITSLEYCPKELNGYFDCSLNNLTSMIDGPEKINGSFYFSTNNIKSSIGFPKKINGNFNCYSNHQLQDLDNFPKEINDLICGYNSLTIEDYPYMCIIKGIIKDENGKCDKYSWFKNFKTILKIVKQNQEIFSQLRDDKTRFHQMIMLLEPDLISYYKTIPPPSKKAKLLI